MIDERGALIVANHASWLDIPVLCTAVDGPFKFIAKGERASNYAEHEERCE